MYLFINSSINGGGWYIKTGFLCVPLAAVLKLAVLDQVGLKLRDPPASTSQVLKLKV